ncbi:E3 ubiquitin-protein ligase [Drechslerella dactyloides]|uniref:E3 ubiquitin-protein ligase n=1 Tax=Drechslerella dactyloides TaxID=74499 RepID=A0AAD6IX46_DREDA|nr:E3 ubiquitin-protein ligase [Drechslerella dactyloides]
MSSESQDTDQDAGLQQYIWVNSNTPGGWDTEPELPKPDNSADASASSGSSATAGPSFSQDGGQSTSRDTPRRPRRRRVKQCRICLDTSTEDADPELGRLISPCLCKGSARYVHEECLRAWRLHSANEQSFYKCPTCHFEYQFRRLKIAQVIASAAVQIGITALIFLITVYVLGFIADPIINLYINPWYAVDGGNFSFSVNGFTVYGPTMRSRAAPNPVAAQAQGKVGLLEHMVRGMSALGLIGFAKLLVFSHNWLRYIFGGAPGVAQRQNGRDRLGQLSWIIIIWGVVNFLIFVWGYVRNWTKGLLDKIAVGVADIGSGQDDDDDDEGVKEE